MLLDLELPEMQPLSDCIPGPEPEAGSQNSANTSAGGKEPVRGIDEPHKRKAWRADATDLARCDFTPGRAQMILRGTFRSISLWRRSIKGMSLAQIKESPDMVPYFIGHMAEFIPTIIGERLDPEHFCIVAPPKRRHKTNNFAATVAQGIAQEIGIPFHDDFALCKNRMRVGAIFTAAYTPPQHNVIVFDDFVTTGSTLTSMKNLLDSLGKNSIFFTAILNKK